MVSNRNLRIFGALAISLSLVHCSSEQETLAEVGRWVDGSMPALFVVYLMKKDIAEAELKEIQAPIGRQLSTQYPFVIQVTVHDPSWAAQLVTETMRRRITSNELPIGSDLVLDETMSVQGGLVYTYYKNGDCDEFIFHERSESR